MALVAIVFAGVFIYSVVAACLGVFACDPLSDDVRHKVRGDYMFLYMILAGFYTYAIFSSSFWARIALMILSSLMALALWQKARDHLPYLLDPTASPAYKVSLSDGLIAALLFFVIQGMIVGMAIMVGVAVSGKTLFIAFSFAGALTYLGVRLSYWRTKVKNIPRVFGKRPGHCIGVGLVTGVAASIVAFIYLYMVSKFGFFHSSIEETMVSRHQVVWWLVLLAVVAAPIFEEFIFRGLIFSGLKRFMPLGGALAASAAVFAIVHPAISVIPVFGLGVFAAMGYARTGLLITPMVAHGVYNAAVIFLPSNFFM